MASSAPLALASTVSEAFHPAGRSRTTETASGGSTVLALPFDVLKTPGLPYRPTLVPLALEPSLRARLDERGDGEAVLVAAFAALLARYTQQAELTIGLHDEDDGAGELVLTVRPETTAAELVEQVGQRLRDLPPGSAAGKLRSYPQVSVARVASALVDTPDPATIGCPDLHLRLARSLDACVVAYNASLFRPDTMARLLGHLGVLAAAIAQDALCRVWHLPLLTAAETAQLLEHWRAPTASYDAQPLFHQVMRHAREQPDAIAVAFRDRTLSYRELDAQANQLAHYLGRHGVGRGARVAVAVEPGLEIAVALLGIFKAGGAYVPIDPTYPRERQAVMLADIRPTVVLTQAHLRGKLPVVGQVVLDLDRPGSLDGYPATAPVLDAQLADVAFVVYTSGTTGKPKGVLLTHGNLVNYVRVAQACYGFDRSHVQPALARFGFSISMFELLLPLVAGGRVVVLERDHVLDFKRLCATLAACTVVHASPSLLRKLIAYVDEQGIDVARFDGLRHVSSGGDLVSADLMEALKRVFRRAELFVIYGCSEIACMGLHYPIARARKVTRNYVGKPFPNVLLRICDSQGALVPIGVVGEIYFGGAGLASGYLDLPEVTREKFVTLGGERFYRTGDMGRYDADGNVEMLGRNDFQIKLRGMRIELAEIEVALRRARGVREAIVLARELHGDKTLVAYVVLDPERPPALAELRRTLQAKLPDYMVPAVFVVLDAMPVNLNQKLDRQALPLPTPADLARQRSLVPPRDEVEARLLAIWQALLATPAVGVEDAFFDVGGDSLLALSLMVEIEKAFGTALPLSTLLTEPTVAALARLLRAPDPEARTSVVLLREGGDAAPVFFIHEGEGEVLPYRNLALRLAPGHRVYGIIPKRRLDYPMLHSRLADVVDYYLQAILRVAPVGPYLLGGLCIGGFLAFEIARRLRAQGRSVAMVALIDVAHVKARPRSVAAARMRRFSAAMTSAGQPDGEPRALRLLRASSRKLVNLVAYEGRTRLRHLRNQAKMHLFRAYLDRGWQLPRFLEHISVDVVLRFAEREYVVPEPYDGELLLFRATQKSSAFDGTLVDDTPYRDMVEDAHLGWDGKTSSGLVVCDVPAGHSSMLQEPHVALIAERMQRYIDRALRSPIGK